MSDYNKQSNSFSKNDRKRNNSNHGNHGGNHGNNHGGNHGNNHGGNHGTNNNGGNRNHSTSKPQPKPVKDNSGEPPIQTFMLGEKEVEGKMNQFHYDKGNYSIFELEGEEKNLLYKSRNSQEAYLKWNVLIGRKKERAARAEKDKEQQG